jgi:hypothetical protein
MVDSRKGVFPKIDSLKLGYFSKIYLISSKSSMKRIDLIIVSEVKP